MHITPTAFKSLYAGCTLEAGLAACLSETLKGAVMPRLMASAFRSVCALVGQAFCVQ